MSRYNNNDGCAAWVIGISVIFLIASLAYQTVKTNIEEILDVFQNVIKLSNFGNVLS